MSSVTPVNSMPRADLELGEHARALYAEDSCECCSSYGSMHLVCGHRSSAFPLQLFPGPDFPCVGVTLALICGLTYLWVVTVAQQLHVVVLVIGLALGGVTTGAYLYCACSDPGIVFKTPENDAIRNKTCPKGHRAKCTQCQVWRPAGASHCYDCDVCIYELDHHCPWTGKCIGQRTLQVFYVFTSTLCVHILFVSITTAIYFVS